MGAEDDIEVEGLVEERCWDAIKVKSQQRWVGVCMVAPHK